MIRLHGPQRSGNGDRKRLPPSTAKALRALLLRRNARHASRISVELHEGLAIGTLSLAALRQAADVLVMSNMVQIVDDGESVEVGLFEGVSRLRGCWNQ
jgi:hypothetical protein